MLMSESRVTELGEIATIGRLFILVSFLQTTPNFRLLFPQQKLCIRFEKMYWAAVWAIFSQTHPVTLATAKNLKGSISFWASRNETFFLLSEKMGLGHRIARFFLTQCTKTGEK
jgi:hypothetical protein